MAREIFHPDQLLNNFTSIKNGRSKTETDFDALTEVGQWFFIPMSDLTKSQQVNNYRPQAPCRLRTEGRKYKTIKGHFGTNEELGIAVQRIA